MEYRSALALFFVVALTLSAGGLAVSLQVSNPLFATDTYRLTSIVTLLVTTGIVGLATVLGVRSTRLGTPYW